VLRIPNYDMFIITIILYWLNFRKMIRYSLTLYISFILYINNIQEQISSQFVRIKFLEVCRFHLK